MMEQEILSKMEAAISVMQRYVELGHSLSCAYSGGKDSTCALVLMVEAIRRAGGTTINHHVQSADTTIENPIISNFLHSVLDELQLYVEASALPVQIHVTTPSLASQFVVSTIGRGTLVRTPENGVRDGRRTRACADEWKVRPGGRLRTLLERRATDDGAREVITVLGLRRDESISRAVAMSERRDSAEVAVRSRTGALTLSPLSEWTSDDVWTMLALLADTESLPFPSPLMPRTIHRLSEIYRAGNGGTCGVVVGDSGARAACGSRFGCSFCLVAGERDKSLEAMIEDEQYGHLRPLNDFRNYLLAIQWDMSRRELVGRSLSDAGYTRIQADTYSYLTRVGLLKMLCSIDAAERDRAEAHSGALSSGSIPDTEENRLLCEPQFEFVTPQQLVAIDFFLSMHHYAPHAFPALAVWHDVNVLGRRYPIPTLESLPKPDIVLHGWYPVGRYDKEAPATGLRSFDAEQWNAYRHPGRPGRYARTTGGEQTVYFEEASQFEVDAEAACLFVTCTYDTAFMLDTQHRDAIDSAHFWLNEGIVKLPIGIRVGRGDMRGRRAASRRSISRKLRSSRWMRKRHACSSPAPTTQLSCWTRNIATRSIQRISG
ncbi:phosphoadenosine phosphosulfate reductase family protein [Caballeronia novacaledonica]|uniref:Phosphoadenosine phosphosulfate reductase family protein n=1 Tax=Caballeronia novacaledonica TaxID=1544861 RepID=A0ACB5R380_9BURK|nr:phosphoadenosine phosphosulfate reductase family protein [Caballeronia novacaledonica]